MISDEQKGDLPVVAHLVHQTVAHSRRRALVDSVLAPGSEVVWLMDLIGPLALCDTDHPQELVNVVTRVPEQTAKDDEDIVHVMTAKNGVRNVFATGHGFTDRGDMS